MSDRSSPSECHHCGATREGHSYLVLYGDWNPERDGFSRAPIAEPVCRSCWREDYQRTVGAHWEVDDADTLWNVLEASNGELVADLYGLFVGGRPYVRVVDGELQCLGIKTKANREAQVLRVVPKFIDVDRAWFDELFNADSDRPTIAIIRPVEETPFGDVRDRGGDSHKIETWVEP
ncbi:hypothetical protein [Natronosalvus amylolyticus]|uniref:hypothetical protein n=1 Tax=Natronosalvus amylolyticus TaxID=2961994 RepID=UPI0020C9590A|nr:hypothetical protein [Natronosalvus amylolyticus]